MGCWGAEQAQRVSVTAERGRARACGTRFIPALRVAPTQGTTQGARTPRLAGEARGAEVARASVLPHSVDVTCIAGTRWNRARHSGRGQWPGYGASQRAGWRGTGWQGGYSDRGDRRKRATLSFRRRPSLAETPSLGSSMPSGEEVRGVVRRGCAPPHSREAWAPMVPTARNRRAVSGVRWCGCRDSPAHPAASVTESFGLPSLTGPGSGRWHPRLALSETGPQETPQQSPQGVRTPNLARATRNVC